MATHKIHPPFIRHIDPTIPTSRMLILFRTVTPTKKAKAKKARLAEWLSFSRLAPP